MDHRYRKYLKNGKEPFRGIMLEILKKYIYYKKKNIFWVPNPKVWLVLSYYSL